MKKKYAFVVSVTDGYIDLAKALIKSINKYHNNADILIVADKYYDELFFDNVSFYFFPEENIKLYGLNRTSRQYRLAFLADHVNNYSAVCFLDADMFLVRNIDKYFKASSGSDVLFASSDCTNVFYGENYRNAYKEAIDKDFYNTKTICAVPIIFNPKHHSSIFGNAYKYCINDNALDDCLAINLSVCNSKHWNNLIVLPAHAWTGIHHTFLKPEMRTKKGIDGSLISEAGEEIYIVHGRWNDKAWIGSLKTVMENYFRGEFRMDEANVTRYNDMVEKSIQVITEEYNNLT